MIEYDILLSAQGRRMVLSFPALLYSICCESAMASDIMG
jgi:hypothetical protein